MSESPIPLDREDDLFHLSVLYIYVSRNPRKVAKYFNSSHNVMILEGKVESTCSHLRMTGHEKWRKAVTMNREDSRELELILREELRLDSETWSKPIIPHLKPMSELRLPKDWD